MDFFHTLALDVGLLVVFLDTRRIDPYTTHNHYTCSIDIAILFICYTTMYLQSRGILAFSCKVQFNTSKMDRAPTANVDVIITTIGYVT